MKKLASTHKSKAPHLVGSPEAFINLLVKDTNTRQWVAAQIENEGPAHKQVLSILLCKRLHKLIKTLETSSDTKFCLQKGYDMVEENEEGTIILPIQLPINIEASADKEKIVEAVSLTPIHEALAYAMCMQVVEWVIALIANKTLSPAK
jgi:hypothetical protein